MGMEGVLLHRGRSALTMLGIIFGVGAVIAMMAIGAGAREETRRRIEQVGATTVFMRAIRLTGEQLAEAHRALSPGLGPEDLEAARRATEAIVAAAPMAPVAGQVVRFKGRQLRARVVGTTHELPAITRRFPRLGRFLTRRDVELRRPVCVLDAGVARELGRHDPLGRIVRIGRQLFTIVGVMPAAEDEALDPGVKLKDRDAGRAVYVPVTCAMETFLAKGKPETSEDDPNFAPLDEAVLKVGDTGDLEGVQALLEAILRRRHRGVEDTQIVVPLDILRQSQRTQEIFNLVMAMIAGLSLLVGGIGIMNIMLANVSERTREIGVKRALGASAREVMGEFLIEAVTLSLLGGLLGIALGWGISASVAYFLGWETYVTADAVLFAFGVSAAVGVTFGFFPARVAARLDPIQALRYE
jgi:putative ABC transport system permease protein